MCARNRSGRVDRCIRGLIAALRSSTEFETLASCCGHGKYPMTIVARRRPNGSPFELMSGLQIPRRRNFYRKDADGFYYLPEARGVD